MYIPEVYKVLKYCSILFHVVATNRVSKLTERKLLVAY